MPKVRKDHGFLRPSPYSLPLNTDEQYKHLYDNEVEEARCPICMEHPHNAVLLVCSSHEKGCRPYMCNTGMRHSNCLDHFYKSQSLPKISCPLCRGKLFDWVVIGRARKCMDSKPRSCSYDKCNFVGNYSQLRMHARTEHPLVIPTKVDPAETHAWSSFEDERQSRDLRSILEPIHEEQEQQEQEVVENIEYEVQLLMEREDKQEKMEMDFHINMKTYRGNGIEVSYTLKLSIQSALTYEVRAQGNTTMRYCQRIDSHVDISFTTDNIVLELKVHMDSILKPITI